MHEMGIASSVLDSVHGQLKLHPGEVATRVGLRIGEFVAVDPDSLRFCFEAIAKDSDLWPIALDIELRCAGPDSRGDELQISYLDLEVTE